MVAEYVGDNKVLRDGVKMPWFGLGVWQGKPMDGPDIENAIRYALQAGYRHIDTAAGYENEVGVGNAVRSSGLARDDIFITTKVRNGDQGYESTLQAFEQSRQKLGLDYVDLYLVHWPVKGKYKDTWKAFEKLHKEGYIRTIGVSNFQIHHLEDLMADAEFVPTVNQVEYHPLLTQKPLHVFCEKHSIQLEAWSPLMQGHLDIPILTPLAEKYGKTPAQIVLRWDLQHEVITIPKSIQQSRIQENAKVFDFELSPEDMATLDELNQDKRFGPDPDNFNF